MWKMVLAHCVVPRQFHELRSNEWTENDNVNRLKGKDQILRSISKKWFCAHQVEYTEVSCTKGPHEIMCMHACMYIVYV